MRRAWRALALWTHLAAFGGLIGIMALRRAFNPKSVGSHWRGAVGLTHARVLERLRQSESGRDE